MSDSSLDHEAESDSETGTELEVPSRLREPGIKPVVPWVGSRGGMVEVGGAIEVLIGPGLAVVGWAESVAAATGGDVGFRASGSGAKPGLLAVWSRSDPFVGV